MTNWNKIHLSKQDIDLCWDFSNNFINQENQYNRMMQRGLSASGIYESRVKRTFSGKLGEMAFYRFLEERGLNAGNLQEMFAIYQGKTNVDKFDFKTAAGQTIDVKTAVFANHKRLLVPIDQFQNMPKSYYVGTKLILPYNVQNYTSEFTKDCIGDIYICGFATYEQMEWCNTVNLGEYPCKAKPLSDLMEIDWLLQMF